MGLLIYIIKKASSQSLRNAIFTIHAKSVLLNWTWNLEFKIVGVIICSPFGFNCSPCGWILDMNSGFYGSYLGVLLCVVGLSLIACGCVPQSVTGMEASTTKVWISANWRATSTMTTTTPCKSSGVFFSGIVLGYQCRRAFVLKCLFYIPFY